MEIEDELIARDARLSLHGIETKWLPPSSEDVEGLGTWGIVFGIMSTIVGGGMLSIPWAFYKSGIVLSIVFSVLTSI